MTIFLYQTLSEVNKVDKDITLLTTLTGNLREESSLIDPEILIDGFSNYIDSCNYVYIQEFNRYYFVRNVTAISNTLFRISLHVDVLYTYKTEIRSNYAIVSRNENEFDLMLNDGLFVTQQNPRKAQFDFPSGFTHWDFVLAIAGN